MAYTNKVDNIDKLEDIKDKISGSYDYFKDNIDRFNKFMNFTFFDQLSSRDRQVANNTGRPDLQFNHTSVYANRIIGNFSDQTPDAKVSAKNQQSDPMTVQVVNGYLTNLVFKANSEGFSTRTIKETIGGGYSAWRVRTDYESDDSFDQEIILEKVDRVTQVYFDPMAQLPCKSDGEYCGCIYPMEESKFKKMYPKADLTDLDYNMTMGDFSWGYENKGQKIVILCDHYEKEYYKENLNKLADGSSVTDEEYQMMIDNWNSIAQPPVVTEKRKVDKFKIKKCLIIGNQILEEEEIDYPGLPYIFVDGNSITATDSDTEMSYKQVTIPYAYNAEGAQNLLNTTLQIIATDINSMRVSTIMASTRAIPSAALEAWRNPQIARILLYEDMDEEGNPVTPPGLLPRPEIPATVMQISQSAGQLIQNILGSFDDQLGQNDSSASGKALIEGANQNNASAKPFLNGYLSAFGTAMNMIVKMIPKYINTPRTIPVMTPDGKRAYVPVNQTNQDGSPSEQFPHLDYNPSTLDVNVTAGPNFETQKNQALTMLTQLMNTSQGMNQLINTQGLGILADNLNIKGSEQLKDMANQFMQQQAQQAQQAQQSGQQQPNPAVMAAQAKSQELQLQGQKQQQDFQISQAKLQQDQQKIDNSHTEALLKINMQQDTNEVQTDKAHAEIVKATSDVAIAHKNHALAVDHQQHNHTQDVIKSLSENIKDENANSSINEEGNQGVQNEAPNQDNY